MTITQAKLDTDRMLHMGRARSLPYTIWHLTQYYSSRYINYLNISPNFINSDSSLEYNFIIVISQISQISDKNRNILNQIMLLEVLKLLFRDIYVYIRNW